MKSSRSADIFRSAGNNDFPRPAQAREAHVSASPNLCSPGNRHDLGSSGGLAGGLSYVFLRILPEVYPLAGSLYFRILSGAAFLLPGDASLDLVIEAVWPHGFPVGPVALTHLGAGRAWL